MCREDHTIFAKTGVIENLRRVAMRKEVVGLEIFVQLDEMQVAARLFAGTAGAGLAIADDVAPRSDDLGFGERTEREDHAGGVAAGIGDQARFCDFGGVQLGQTVSNFT